MQVCVLGSGSKGNATLVETQETKILVDAGFSGKEIERRMVLVGRSCGELSAIVVTHEHNDHIAGVGVLARRYNIPVYINEGTHAACSKKLKQLPELRYFTTGVSFSVGGVTVHPFSVSHDTADPVGFVFEHDNLQVGYCTDTGRITQLIRFHLKKCRALILESNHDPEMLRQGPYPLPLQQRISSASGHLKNEEALIFAKELGNHNLCHLILAHLSETNNAADLVKERATQSLATMGSLNIYIAQQHAPGPVIRVAD